MTDLKLDIAFWNYDRSGGPKAVSQQNFCIGVNDPVGLDPWP